jgi:hypothetical protein
MAANGKLVLRKKRIKTADLFGGPTDIDDDPKFRKVLLFLNRIKGVRTMSSCQGHYGQYGIRYMDPYITFSADTNPEIFNILKLSPFRIKNGTAKGVKDRVAIRFGKQIVGHWDRLLSYLDDVVKHQITKK